jgi:choice-of-anchor B domain-containing protein
LLAAAGSAAAADCPPAPGGPLAPGQELRWGDRAFELQLSRASRSEGGSRLGIDLLVRRIDAASGEFRGATQPSRMSGRLLLADALTWKSEAALGERIGASGTSLAATVELPVSIAGPLTIELELDGRCPLTLSYEVDLSEMAPASGGTQQTAGQPLGAGLRVNLISQIDILDGELSSDIWGYSDGATHLAILGSRSGTLFIDVTDAANPSQVGFVPGPSSPWRDMKTYQHYVYIVTEGGGSQRGLQIVDLGDPLNPQHVATYTTNFNTCHNIWIDEQRGHAYLVGTDNGTRILDLSNPVAPVEIASWTDRYVHDAYVKDNIAYYSEIYVGLHEIFDVTDVTNHVPLASWTTVDGVTHNSWISDDKSIVVTTDEVASGHMAVYDISDLSGPIPLLSEFQPNPAAIVHNAIFDDGPGDRVAISHYDIGFEYADLQRPTFPVQLGSYDTYLPGDAGTSGAWGVYPFDPRGYFYMGDRSSGLFVLEYAPTGGTLTGGVADASDDSPVAWAEVQLLSHGQSLTANLQGEFGGYVAAGDLLVRVSAPGYKTKILDAGELPFDGGLDLNIELDPLPQTALFGTVRAADNQQPVGGARVSIVGTSLRTTTDAFGDYAFPSSPVGQWTVAADAFGYAGVESTVLLSAAQPGTLDLDLERASFVEDFESAFTAWSVSSTAVDGDWVLVDPIGTGGGTVQPENDHTPPPGVSAYVTGQGPPGGEPEDGDLDGGATTLTSPVRDLLGMQNPQLSYHRWFSTQSGAGDGGTYLIEVSDDAGSNWSSVELLVQEANSWQETRVNLIDYFVPSSQFQVRFTCEQYPDFDDLRILECGMDDVEIVEECRTRMLPTLADADSDGTVDLCDACPADAANDADGDGICGDLDNAPFVANADQLDLDADGVGDAVDNCIDDPNADQRDLDGDGLGDACDDDLDGDGTDNGLDDDQDGDGILDVADLCPTVPDTAQPDDDSDGEGDGCDLDDLIVHGLRVDGDVVRWQPESGADSYNLYRGAIGADALVSLSDCRATELPVAHYVDTRLPAPGDGFLYLATTVSGGVEGSPGRRSDGSLRTINEPCP